MLSRTLALAAVAFSATVAAASAQLPPTGPTWAAPPSLHNIAWYKAHAPERAAVLRFCHSDHRYGNTPDCANAESADTGAYADRLQRQLKAMNGSTNRTSPAYWLGNNYARWNAVAACSVTPDPGFSAQYTPAECAAARQADAMAPARLRTHFAPWQ